MSNEDLVECPQAMHGKFDRTPNGKCPWCEWEAAEQIIAELREDSANRAIIYSPDAEQIATLTEQLAAAQAAIEAVKGDMHLTQMTPNPNDPGAYVLGGDAEKALAQSSTDALETVKHKVWTEGFQYGSTANGADVNNDGSCGNPELNPYRAETT